MSGLVKAKKYNWKDSNIALVGSKEDRKVKKEAAQTEKAWVGAGQKVGLQIWRIEQFKVVHWDKNEYGNFFEGDSYIILNTYQDPEAKKQDPDTKKLLYDVHFWIGKESTQDEYGTAAYKTVELDTLLDDVPVQHREVQGHESDLFRSYFKTITHRKGGCATGFKHVEPEKYKSRLLKISTEEKVVVKEIPLIREKIVKGDIYILDKGLEIFQFNTEGASLKEIRRASEYVVCLKEERLGKAISTVVDKDDPGDFYDQLDAAIEAKGEQEEDDDDDDEQIPNEVGKVYKLSDESGELEFSMIKENGEISKKDLKSDDVYIVHKGKEIFVWIGRRASENERLNGMTYATQYLNKHCTCQLLPITVVGECQRNKQFEMAVSA